MMEALRAFPHDAADSWREGSVFLGNTNLHITPESKDEVLPRQAEQGAVILTADAIIDNRAELLAAFQIPTAEAGKTADSELILQAWLRWGEDCPRHLIGDYAFAIWDARKEELFCARDHVGKRTFYYYLSDERFAFCTVIKPLLAVKGKGRELNEEWIANYFSLLEGLHELDTSATIYQEIRQLPPAHTLKVSARSSEIKKYWNPMKLPPLKLRTDEEYEEAFRQVYFEAVACCLRGSGEVGAMLSGGLDSGSVACIAAGKLAAEGKRLKTYTEVPFVGYENWLSANSMADEREYVQAVIDQYDNIDPAFCDAEGLTAYNSLERLTRLLEHPYKFIQNFYWLDAIAAQASRDGVRILLGGQMGNGTVSYSSLDSALNAMFRKGRWLTLLREMRCYAERMNVTLPNNRRILKHFLRLNFPQSLKKEYRRFRGRPAAEPLLAMPLRLEQAARWQTDQRLKALGMGKYAPAMLSLREERKAFLCEPAFSQIGEMDTKLGLVYGMVRRDPTADKRVIEFCLRLPPEQLLKNGLDRGLIRRALAGILPDKVRLNLTVRGVQSADWIQRLRSEWPRLKEDLVLRLAGRDVDEYIDGAVVKEILDSMEEYPEDRKDHRKMLMFIYILAMSQFLESIRAEDGRQSAGAE
jgi:asparagine synthase (glutamine-hydrolysing)